MAHPPQRKDVTPGMRLFEGNFAFHSERREKKTKGEGVRIFFLISWHLGKWVQILRGSIEDFGHFILDQSVNGSKYFFEGGTSEG